MESSEYFQAANYIADDIIRVSKTDTSKMNEQEKQIMGAFCFGALYGYSLENRISTVQG